MRRGAEPRNEQEALLCKLFAAVLGMNENEVGIHDNFFDLGGHSLLASRLVSKIRTVMKLKLPVRAVFVTPTVAELVESLRDAPRLEGQPELRPRSAQS
jgi:acyl carrier protein